jgi:hypothetical protein
MTSLYQPKYLPVWSNHHSESDFPRLSKMRAWDRVPVPAAAAGLKGRQIMKRIPNTALVVRPDTGKGEPTQKRRVPFGHVRPTMRGEKLDALFDPRTNLNYNPGLWDLTAAQGQCLCLPTSCQ